MGKAGWREAARKNEMERGWRRWGGMQSARDERRGASSGRPAPDRGRADVGAGHGMDGPTDV